MKKIMCFLALFLCANSVFSQNNEIKVKVFDGNEVEQENEASDKASRLDKNLISLNPYLLFRGAFVVGYERVIHPNHTIGGYFGFTYQDMVYQVFTDIENNAPITSNEVKPGHYLDLSYKWYPKGYDNFEGVYLSPGFVSRAYHQSRVVNLDYSTDATAQLGYSMTEGYLKFGYVYESWLFNEIVSDFYFGIGYRTITSQEYSIDEDITGKETLLQYTKVKGLPAVYLGFRIGIPF